ncbi:MAG TPA: ABC transporter permease [Bacteroidales bacterium]|nr:ABC transporter permease [Bacteroidales bacterium]HOQ58683.1 ABC transporter permease [Bacteroidales bacterium]
MKNNFLPFVKKESLHILRDKRTMLIVMLIPVILMVMFGFAISTEVNNINIAVVAPERTGAVKDVVGRIAHNDYFTFYGYIDQDQIDKKLRSGKVSVVAVFTSNFDRRMEQISAGLPSKPVIQFIVDASNVNTASASIAYLQSILPGTASQQAMFETRMLFNPQMKSAYNFVPGIMGLIFILVCAIMTSVSIVREKEVGTMEVLLVSPVRPVKIVFAKMIPYFVISCVILAMILLLAHYLLDVPMSGGIWGIFSLSLLYIVLSLSLGLLISTVTKTQVAALLISAMVMLVPVLLLSGIIFPIENFPKFFELLSNIIPARWYIAAIRKMMIQGAAFTAVWKEGIVLLGMTVVFIGISLKKFNDKLE